MPKKIPYSRIKIAPGLMIRPYELPGPQTDIPFCKDESMVNSYNILSDNYGWPENIFEVGLEYGGSLLLWHWLGIRSAGIDHDIDKFRPKEYCDKNKVGYFNCTIFDQEKVRGIMDLIYPNGVDWIIDDGPHTIEGIPVGFDVLWGRLRPKGLYIIEDWSVLWQEHRMQLIDKFVNQMIGNWILKGIQGEIAGIQLFRTMIVIEKA